MKRLSEEENARRYELHRQGLSDGEMARSLGLNRDTVKAWRIYRGLKCNREPKHIERMRQDKAEQARRKAEQARRKAARAEGMQALEREAAGAREQGLSYGKWRAMQADDK